MRKKRKQKKEKKKKYWKYQNQYLQYKKDRFEWQKRLESENKRARLAAQNKLPAAEVISSRDTDATATKTGFSNLASVGLPLAKLGIGALVGRIRQNQEDQSPGEEGGNKKGKKKFKKFKKDIESAMVQSQRLLPPASSSEFEKTDKTRVTPPSSGRTVPPISRPFTVSQRVRMSRRVLPSSINRPSSGGMAPTPKPEPTSPVNPEPGPETAGQRARRDIKFRRNLISQRSTPMEEFSCWREEFLYELGDLRKKVRDKNKLIDIMSRGRNSVTIGPNVTEKYDHEYFDETTNTSSIFAKATPPLKKRTTPLSDVYLSKQPGKGNAEMVQKKMMKLFLGDRRDFTSNYDLSGHKSDDSEFLVGRNYLNRSTNEAYDDGDDETFRQHSRKNITSPSGGSTRGKSTSAVLRAMEAMNNDVVPPKKKKKKKKKVTPEQ
jgi:hypothetical protein